MKAEQKTVAVGGACGVLGTILSVWLLAKVLPAPVIADMTTERLAYALRANVLAIVPLFIMIITIAKSRFLSEAIDPTRRAESRLTEIDCRATDNTFQQTFLFAVTSLAVSTLVPLQQLPMLWTCAIVFAVARVLFWLGYRINPLYRAPGMSATACINFALLSYALYGTFMR